MTTKLESTSSNIHEVGNIHFENGYGFYNFIKAVSGIIDEAEIIFDPNKGTAEIRAMDASRICLIQITIKNSGEDLNFLNVNRNFKFGINLEDLAKILNVRKNDKKELNIEFNDMKAIVTKTMRKLNSNYVSNTKNTIGRLDIEIEDIPLENLHKIEYNVEFAMEKPYLEDWFRESNIYSEICKIEGNEDGITISEAGQIGDHEFSIESQNLLYFRIRDSKSEAGSYSLAFLNILKKILTVMSSEQYATFHLKDDHPLRVKIEFDEINTEMILYLAPRCEEVEFDEEDMDEF